MKEQQLQSYLSKMEPSKIKKLKPTTFATLATDDEIGRLNREQLESITKQQENALDKYGKKALKEVADTINSGLANPEPSVDLDLEKRAYKAAWNESMREEQEKVRPIIIDKDGNVKDKMTKDTDHKLFINELSQIMLAPPADYQEMIDEHGTHHFYTDVLHPDIGTKGHNTQIHQKPEEKRPGKKKQKSLPETAWNEVAITMPEHPHALETQQTVESFVIEAYFSPEKPYYPTLYIKHMNFRPKGNKMVDIFSQTYGRPPDPHFIGAGKPFPRIPLKLVGTRDIGGNKHHIFEGEIFEDDVKRPHYLPQQPGGKLLAKIEVDKEGQTIKVISDNKEELSNDEKFADTGLMKKYQSRTFYIP